MTCPICMQDIGIKRYCDHFAGKYKILYDYNFGNGLTRIISSERHNHNDILFSSSGIINLDVDRIEKLLLLL
jgi:hypothetical protein